MGGHCRCRARGHAGDYRAFSVGQLEVCAIDGSLIRTPDTPDNRAGSGSAGIADGTSQARVPQVDVDIVGGNLA